MCVCVNFVSRKGRCILYNRGDFIHLFTASTSLLHGIETENFMQNTQTLRWKLSGEILYGPTFFFRFFFFLPMLYAIKVNDDRHMQSRRPTGGVGEKVVNGNRMGWDRLERATEWVNEWIESLICFIADGIFPLATSLFLYLSFTVALQRTCKVDLSTGSAENIVWSIIYGIWVSCAMCTRIHVHYGCVNNKHENFLALSLLLAHILNCFPH